MTDQPDNPDKDGLLQGTSYSAISIDELALNPVHKPRRPRKRRLIRWYGLPSWTDAKQHGRMIARHLLALLGLRP